MKAMALVEFGKELKAMELPDPTPSDNDVILNVTACGVCQTDLKIVAGVHPCCRKIKMPHVPGHEVCGTVAAFGSGVHGWNIGDKAVAMLTIGCGVCEFCHQGRPQLCTGFKTGTATSIGFTINGGFGEKVRIPAANLVKVSHSISDAEAAIIPDAVATALHAVVDRAEVRPGERVLIFGAGGVGLHAIQMAALCGADTYAVDVDPEKLVLAKKNGASHTLLAGTDDFSQVRVDKIIETSGFLSKNMWLLDLLKEGGTMVIVGYKPDVKLQAGITEIVSREYIIKGSRGCTYPNLVTCVDLVERGLLKPLVGVTYSFEQANEALADLRSGKINGRGVLCRDKTGSV